MALRDPNLRAPVCDAPQCPHGKRPRARLRHDSRAPPVPLRAMAPLCSGARTRFAARVPPLSGAIGPTAGARGGRLPASGNRASQHDFDRRRGCRCLKRKCPAPAPRLGNPGERARPLAAASGPGAVRRGGSHSRERCAPSRCPPRAWHGHGGFGCCHNALSPAVPPFHSLPTESRHACGPCFKPSTCHSRSGD